MKKNSFIFTLLFLTFLQGFSQNKIKDQVIDDNFNFIIATDLGRNGRYDQKKIAELMGETASDVDAKFIISSGDTHHYLGVESIDDPLWMTNFELIYSHPELQIPWYQLLGNHEYRGNTQAVIDYSKKSRRWEMPDRYYTQVYNLGNKEKLRIVYIDTPPLIDKYQNDDKNYPDASKQDANKQLAWIDSVLTNSSEKWKIVVGHHPIYAETSKSNSERLDLQKRVDPILQKNNVDMYICGHLHTFQHLKTESSKTDYIVNSSGSLSRIPKPIKETIFCSPETGFSVVSANNKELILFMIDNEGEVIHKIVRKK